MTKNKDDILDEVWEMAKSRGIAIQKQELRIVLECVLESVAMTLVTGAKAEIRGYFSLGTKRVGARSRYSGLTKTTVTTPEHREIVVKGFQELLDRFSQADSVGVPPPAPTPRKPTPPAGPARRATSFAFRPAPALQSLAHGEAPLDHE